MKHLTHTTRIFIGLFIITMLLTYLALTLTMQMNAKRATTSADIRDIQKKYEQIKEQTAVQPVDTKDWQTYTSKNYPFKFQYPKGWQTQVVDSSKLGYFDLTIKPNDKTPAMHIYLSSKSFVGFEGLKTQEYTSKNLSGIMVSDSLIGVKAGETYYTFDGSLNQEHLDIFKGIMSTVEFPKETDFESVYIQPVAQ